MFPPTFTLGGLYELWGKEGKQYGLPKDWDTIALIYNKEMLAKAGVDPKELENLTWNPQDGGTFGQLIAKLSIDEAGNNGLSPNFNPKKVKQYGLLGGRCARWLRSGRVEPLRGLQRLQVS